MNGKYSPNEVTFENAAEIEAFMRSKKMRRHPKLHKNSGTARFVVGDLVVNSIDKKLFEKGIRNVFIQISSTKTNCNIC